ncbi:MAG: T9SS type B sorting domain-containing protein [Bacteroidota bacterium]
MHLKTLVILFFTVLLLPLPMFGQGETSNWYFGNGAGIGFNNDGSTRTLTDGRLNTFEGCASISDAFGDLLFYTDGITVYDRNHNIMENGTGLYGDPSSTQSALIVPKPEDPRIFFIFTVDTSIAENDPDFGLNYSVVDISLNDGNGAIIEKNSNLLPDCSEKITAVLKDCFDQSVWVITLATDDLPTLVDSEVSFFQTYHAFEINTTGVVKESVKSKFEDLRITDPRGYLKLSADGTKIASANSSSGLYIYDFDAKTGLLSNQEMLNITSANKSAYGIEFSPNQKYLYAHTSNNFGASETEGHSSSLIQFDLAAENISDSQMVLDTREIYRGALQLGQNGKIYRTIAKNYFNGTPYLGVIHNPNMQGNAANYEHNAVFLNGNNATQGLPPFVQSFFDQIGLIKNDDGTRSNSLAICSGETFTLEADFIPGAVYNWEKDDIPIDNPSNSYHIETSEMIDSGRYRLEIIPPDPSECPIIGDGFIEVRPIPAASNTTLMQCDIDGNDPNDGITAFNLEQVILTDDYTFSFFESMEDMDSNNPISNPVGYTNTRPFNQTIYYTVIDSFGCENSGDIALEVIPGGMGSTMQNLLYTCDENPDDELLLGTFDLETFGSTNFSGFDWVFYASPRDASLEENPLPNTYISEPATIYVRLENNNQCQGIEQLELIVNPSPIFKFEETFLLCTDGPPLTLNAPLGFDTYKWIKKEGDSETIVSTDQSVPISMLGNYSIELGYEYHINGEILSCATRKEFIVNPSNKAIINDILIEDISDNNVVEILVSGDGDYEFSLNGVDYQDANTFVNVLAGFITVYVRDKNGCGISEELISIIGYPKFFTPNGDGVNDSWQILGVNEQFQTNTSISIYDRYGKLIVVIGPESPGWDGTYNNRFLPSSDYWFKVELEDGREFKGHFALKK